MKALTRLLSIAILICTSASATAERIQQRDDWATFFEAADAVGTIVLWDERNAAEKVLTSHERRAKTRYSPASTFKIPHALFALDSGVVQDEFQKFQWDGQKREIEAWNQDQNLRSSMRNSVVWVYEEFAEKIGQDRERTYLEKINYGNADPSGASPFWIDGHLEISALEQVQFLRRLYRNQLPFRIDHQRLVKDVMIVEAGRDWILRAKTGWSGSIGWWVGYVEWPSGPVFFVLNIDTPNKRDDLQKRELVARKILESVGALPAKL